MTYVFSVKQSGMLATLATVDLPGEYDLDAAKRVMKARFPEAVQISFQSVEKTRLEEVTADTSFQEPGYGPWK